VADADTDIIELQDRLSSLLPADKLPSDAGKVAVRFTKDGVPTVTPKDVPIVDVHLDREKLSALGILVSDVEALVAKYPNPSKDGKVDDGLENTMIAVKDGNPVRLRDVATFKVASKPDCLVRGYPPCPPGATGTPSFDAPVPR
jgi:multidrug efflux pump subunit AcrB